MQNITDKEFIEFFRSAAPELREEIICDLRELSRRPSARPAPPAKASAT